MVEKGSGRDEAHGQKVNKDTQPHVRGQVILEDEGLTEGGREGGGKVNLFLEGEVYEG